jgi:hypothetical protein
MLTRAPSSASSGDCEKSKEQARRRPAEKRFEFPCEIGPRVTKLFELSLTWRGAADEAVAERYDPSDLWLSSTLGHCVFQRWISVRGF